MIKIPLALWIANAAACLGGRYGDVTRQARAAGCSRQTAYELSSAGGSMDQARRCSSDRFQGNNAAG